MHIRIASHTKEHTHAQIEQHGTASAPMDTTNRKLYAIRMKLGFKDGGKLPTQVATPTNTCTRMSAYTYLHV